MAAGKKQKEGASGGDSFLGPIESFAMSVVSPLPIKQLSAWISAFFRPVETYEAEKGNALFSGTLVYLLLIGLVSGALSFLLYLVGSALGDSLALQVGIAEAFLTYLIISPLFLTVLAFIFSAFLFVVAKVLGGKGGYIQQTFGLTLVYGGLVLVSIPFSILARLPFVGFLFALISLLPLIYAIYGYFLLLRHMHGVSSLRTAIIMLVPAAVAFVLVLAVGVIVGAAAMGRSYLY